MLVTEIPSQFGSLLRQVKVSLFSTDLAALTTAGAKNLTLTGMGGVTAANALSAVNSGTLQVPIGGKVLGVQQHLVTAFAGGSLSALTCSVGKVGGSATFLTTAFDIFQAAGDTVVQETALFKSGQNSAWSVQVTLTPTGDVCSAATAGQVDIYIVYLSVSDPTA